MSTEKKKYTIKRNDLSADKSLRAWSAADEYLLQEFTALAEKPAHLAIYNDRFGFLGCNLHSYQPTIVLTQKSQEKAIKANLQKNYLSFLDFSNPLASFEKELDFAIIKVPKSLALFQLFLEQIANNSTQEVTVIAAFMTRHFSPKLLQIAESYFEVVEQTKALKKARVMVLRKKKEIVKRELLRALEYNHKKYQQYSGVFSADHIDYATQYFLKYLQVEETDQCILDLGSGNGVIANEIFKQSPTAEIHLLDDAYLAVASAQLNIQGENIHHHFNDDLSPFKEETFDLIVTNPPFHFEYEINIQIPIQLFKACFRCLKKGGNLQLVSNKHLNYKTHLEKIFPSVQMLADNEKFIIYQCVK